MPYKDPEKERERSRKRRLKPEYKKYQRNYQRKWRKNNPKKIKEIQQKHESKPERKEYLKKWWKISPKAKAIRKRFNKSRKRKDYDRKWTKENADKVKKKYGRYYHSIKGIINRLKKNERKKFKIKEVTDNITTELIRMVNDRDKNCVYCGKKLPVNPKRDDIHYDHINPFKPFSKTNMVRCCGKCNKQKANADVIQWCDFKEYKPAKIVYTLLKEDKKKEKVERFKSLNNSK